jgi:hypothetical protein
MLTYANIPMRQPTRIATGSDNSAVAHPAAADLPAPVSGSPQSAFTRITDFHAAAEAAGGLAPQIAATATAGAVTSGVVTSGVVTSGVGSFFRR